MTPEVSLLIHNVGHVVSAVATIGILIVLLLRKNKTRVDIAFILGIVGMLFFTLPHVIGVNIADPHLSKNVLMFNMAIILIAGFAAHTILGLINEKKYKYHIIVFYIISISFFIFFLIFPETYLLDSAPQLYFPNYYVPGKFRWISSLLFYGTPVYCLFFMITEAYKAIDEKQKNRLYLFSLIVVLSYGFGGMAEFLVYNIPVDPILSILYIPLFILTSIYAIYKYELFDIRVIAKKAFIFAIQVSAMSVFFTSLSFLNQLVTSKFPFVPVWGVPLLSSIAVVLIGVYVWRRVRETDLLKYEFITIITHKFRTPLTRIKYAIAEIKATSIAEEKKMEIEEIEHSASVLVDLTGELVSLTESENESHSFTTENIFMGDFVKSLVPLYADRITNKKIDFSVDDKSNGVTAMIDTTYMKSVMQVLIENALTYTPIGGKVCVYVTTYKNMVIIEVRDTGVGIPKAELALVFGKFFRGVESSKIDTEGMGIGLFIARSIVTRHKGKIWVESEGVGKGSSIFVSLPKGE